MLFPEAGGPAIIILGAVKGAIFPLVTIQPEQIYKITDSSQSASGEILKIAHGLACRHESELLASAAVSNYHALISEQYKIYLAFMMQQRHYYWCVQQPKQEETRTQQANETLLLMLPVHLPQFCYYDIEAFSNGTSISIHNSCVRYET